MTRTLIVGIDTVAGHSLAQQMTLHLARRSEVSGLWFSEPEFIKGCRTARVSSKSLSKELPLADIIVFCGGAARSSWDAEFGDFSREQQWLNECIAATGDTGAKLVLISSDAVFSGPWVFHDDNSTALADDRNAKTLLKYESLVRQVPNSLIVRTNVLGTTPGSLVADSVAAIRKGHQLTADATTFATPIDAESFAVALASCIDHGVSGDLNIAGAERVTPFHFLLALANQLNLNINQIQSALKGGTSSEHSMRCNRLRNEYHLSAPLKWIVLEHLALAFQEPLNHRVAA